jgi:hypothetical protein
MAASRVDGSVADGPVSGANNAFSHPRYTSMAKSGHITAQMVHPVQVSGSWKTAKK